MIRRVLLGGAVLGWWAQQRPYPECCGVVGVVMREPVSKEKKEKSRRYTTEEFLCEGIELLKNRGYDSAGVYTTAFQG